jgi:hypothetical protein
VTNFSTFLSLYSIVIVFVHSIPFIVMGNYSYFSRSIEM